jgi:hypothetical protein
MQSFKIPKDNDKYRWTNHIVRKMMHYRLTPSRVLRIVRAPERLEEGVAPGTVAGMHSTGSKAKPTEIWAMWRDEKKRKSSAGPLASPRKIIITAWRYPGVSNYVYRHFGRTLEPRIMVRNSLYLDYFVEGFSALEGGAKWEKRVVYTVAGHQYSRYFGDSLYLRILPAQEEEGIYKIYLIQKKTAYHC